MGKQILTSLGWTAILFVLMALIKYFTGVDNWLVDTLDWVIPSGVGYFLGYGQGRRDENR